MLQKLNERIQGVIAWLVVILIGITFTLFGVDYYLQSHQTTNAKVTVNDESLTEQAFEVNYRRARGMQDVAHMSAEDEKKLQSQVLDQMVTNEVLVQAAHHNGFGVSANQANAAILSIPQFQEDGHFSAEKYQQALSAAYFTQSSFQNEVRQGMLLNQQRFAFIGSSFALPGEIERFVKLFMQTRDYDYLTIDTAHFEKDVHVNPDAITEYYKQHQKQFMTPEQVSLDYVTLSMNDIKNHINTSEEDIKRFYHDNESNYLTPAQWHVAHILFAVPETASKEEQDDIQKKADDAFAELQKDPSQFDKLVSTVSDDKLSITDHGELPWMTAGQNEYGKILSNLTKPNEISAPAKTKHGYEIFKLLAYKPATQKSLAEVETTIKKQLITEMAQNKYAQTLEQLSDLSYQSPDSLTSVSEALHLKIVQTKLFSRAGGDDELTRNPQVINAAFSHDVLELGNNSDPIQLDNDSVAVIRVNERIPEKEQSLDAVREQIHKILVKQIAEIKAKELGASLLAPIDDKKQQEFIANHLTWISVEKASRDSDKTESLINDAAFNLLRPGSRGSVILPNGNFVVVKLKQINDGKLNSLDKEQRDSLVQQIEASYGMMDYDLYVKRLINQAQIVRH
ncbi:MAG: SurA N-terminal domain-containing protein [Legionella sp.]|uniref:SurA N-terminal domain-containing protein n=1 Tax=Legionella sp. TaxID=459 RepID=UPI0039E2ED73